jgi:outer membrane immunogenic protein
VDIRKILLAAAVAIPTISGGAAFAADLPQPYVAPPAAAAPFSWTGLYVGLNGLYGTGTSAASFTAPNFFVDNADNPALSLDANGALVGLTLGYNWQTSNNLVLGIEGDLDAGKISGAGNYDPQLDLGGVIPETLGEHDYTWQGTLRGRIGFTNTGIGGANTLWYLTGGAAWTSGNRWIENSVVNPADFTSASHMGWTFGGGVEHAINNKWSVKLEYLYTDFGSADYTDQNSSVVTRVHPTVSEFKFGINLKLF